MSRTAAVACLTGAGTAPELMAEAVLALDAVGRLHGLEIDDTHVSFGGIALAKAGQAVPAATRSAILGADAVLVAGADEPALAEVMSELDLRAELTAVRFGHEGALAFVTPLEESAEEWAIEVAFQIAESRAMRLAVVGDAPWNELVDAVADRHEQPEQRRLRGDGFHAELLDAVDGHQADLRAARRHCPRGAMDCTGTSSCRGSHTSRYV